LEFRQKETLQEVFAGAAREGSTIPALDCRNRNGKSRTSGCHFSSRIRGVREMLESPDARSDAAMSPQQRIEILDYLVVGAC
jgi:hypothetical protein